MKSLRPLAIALAAACTALGSQTSMASGSVVGPGNSGAQARQVSSADREFMKSAAEAGHAEVQAAQLALQKATDLQLKDYARMLVDDHTQADDRLQQLARAKGVTLPSDPSLSQKGKLEVLRATSGADFDRRFAQTLGVDAHREAIELFQKEVAHGSDPQVLAYARDVLPHLKHHLQAAQQHQARLSQGTPVAQAGNGAVGGAGTSRAMVTDKARQEVLQEVNEAVQVVQRMKSDPRVAEVLVKARGVFLLPTYGRGALGVGFQGGEGVLLKRQGDSFSNPVFYNLAGMSVGAQAGGSGGRLALLLMTDKAVREFESTRKFSLNADAGLTVVNWSRRAQASGGKVQDAIVWSDTKGAYAGASVGLTDVMLDKDANRAYYGRDGLSAQQIIEGRVDNPHSNVLGRVLAL